ncbi:MAG TPA: hypothetical protein VFT22_16185, partial [Kofleriaceae bacterium]|nr:hypothetical protein [Kofleriaceae bacterium]
MKLLRMSCHLGLPALLASCAAPESVSTSDPAPITVAHEVGGLRLTGVPSANQKSAGVTSANVLSPELMEVVAAQGANPVENPQVLPIGEPAVSVTHYGYDSDGPLLPAPGDVQTTAHQVEASKTEPDKNTYLVLHDQTGADPDYDYGTHFLFQGHESGARHAGTITRINLDADAAHRITVMAAADVNGLALPPIDGSTWDPWA